MNHLYNMSIKWQFDNYFTMPLLQTKLYIITLTSKLGNVIIMTTKLVKGAVKMKKEDILMKSQMENHDEGEENAENQGRALGVVVMAAIFCFVTVFSLIFSRNNLIASYAVSAMFWAFLSVYSIPKYRFAKKKSMLIASIGYAIASIASLLSFVITVIK